MAVNVSAALELVALAVRGEAAAAAAAAAGAVLVVPPGDPAV